MAGTGEGGNLPQNQQAGMITLDQASRLILVSGERIRQLVKEGYIPKPGKNQYPLVGVVQGYIRFLKDEERRTSKVAAESGLKAARQREIEMRIAEREHRLIDTSEALAVVDEIVGRYRAEFSGLAARITRDVELRKRIEAEVNGTLQRVSDLLASRAVALRTRGEAVDPESSAES